MAEEVRLSVTMVNRVNFLTLLSHRSLLLMANKMNAQRPSLGSRVPSSVSSSSKGEKEKARASVEDEVEELETGTARPTDTTKGARAMIRTVPPFIASQDIPRGVIYAGQVALEFAFMLAIMYVLSVLCLSVSCHSHRCPLSVGLSRLDL